jgi:hypothetical protein
MVYFQGLGLVGENEDILPESFPGQRAILVRPPFEVTEESV